MCTYNCEKVGGEKIHQLAKLNFRIEINGCVDGVHAISQAQAPGEQSDRRSGVVRAMLADRVVMNHIIHARGIHLANVKHANCNFHGFVIDDKPIEHVQAF